MVLLCKLVKRGEVRANDLPLSNDLEAWPDSSVGRALDVQSQGSRAPISLGSVIFSHFHFLLQEKATHVLGVLKSFFSSDTREAFQYA